MTATTLRPVVMLHDPSASFPQLLFARALASTLESSGLRGSLWFDLHEGMDPDSPHLQLSRCATRPLMIERR
jgi:hypothetical protein